MVAYMDRTPKPVRRAAVLLLLAFVGGCGPDVPRIKPLPENAVVLAFGDSLTFGKGASSDRSYPAVLEGLIGREVVRSGVPGEVTANGLKRLSAALDQWRPNLLILCHGGNDMLRRKSRKKAEANLRQMVRMARSQEIDVVLIGVPSPSPFMSEGAEFYERIATEFSLPYEGKVLAEILSSKAMKSDMVHPNAKGYRKLATALARLLRASGAI